MQEILDEDLAVEDVGRLLESNTIPQTDGTASMSRFDTYDDPTTPNGLVEAPRSLPPLPVPQARPEPPTTPSGITHTAHCGSPAEVFPDPLFSPVYDDYIPSNAPSHVISIATYPLQLITADLYDGPKPSSSSTPTPSPDFASLWRLGLPLLVKGVLKRFKIQWNPQYFMDRYGDQPCLIIDCQTELNKQVNVRQFFAQFGQYRNRTECWKLKVRVLFHATRNGDLCL